MRKPYQFFINPFLVIGNKSFRKAIKLSRKTYNELKARQADPFYAAQYILYAPYHETLMIAYTKWKAQGGLQKGATLTFTQLLKLLPKKMNAFAALVVTTSSPDFEKGTTNYVSVFPNDLGDFPINNSIETRMTALIALSETLGKFVALAPVKAIFDPYLLILTNAQSKQIGNVGTTGTDSDDLKTAVTEAMQELYGFLGLCIHHFKKDATVLNSVFDMLTLRNHRQLKFTGTLTAAEMRNIMEHTFDDFDEITLTAKESSLTFYLALNPFDGPIGYTLITVPANTSITIDASLFNNTATNKFLCVINNDTVTAKFTVKPL